MLGVLPTLGKGQLIVVCLQTGSAECLARTRTASPTGGRNVPARQQVGGVGMETRTGMHRHFLKMFKTFKVCLYWPNTQNKTSRKLHTWAGENRSNSPSKAITRNSRVLFCTTAFRLVPSPSLGSHNSKNEGRNERCFQSQNTKQILKLRPNLWDDCAQRTATKRLPHQRWVPHQRTMFF